MTDPKTLYDTLDNSEISTNTAQDGNEIKYTGFVETFINMVNTTVGAGILSIPNSFTFCGLVPSAITLTLSAVFSFLSATLIIKMNTLTEIHSYSILSSKIGKIGRVITDASIALFTYSCLIAYVIMSVEIIQSWMMLANLDLHSFWRRTATVLIFCFGFQFILTYPRNMSFLTYVSFFCLVAVVMFFVGMVYKGIKILPREGINQTAETFRFDLSIFNCIAIHFLTFSVSAFIIPVVKTMKPHVQRRTQAWGLSFFSCYLMVLIPAVIGYLLFGQNAQPLILNNFEDSDPLFIIIRIACFILLVATYPIVGLTAMNIFSALIFDTADHENLPFLKRGLLLMLENGIPLIVAIFLPNVRPALAIGGALGGGVTNFCLPPLMYVFVYNKKMNQPITWLMIAFSVIGTVLCAIATYMSVIDAINAFKNQK